MADQARLDGRFGVKATPAGGGERNWMHSVLGRALETLKREGVDMVLADARPDPIRRRALRLKASKI